MNDGIWKEPFSVQCVTVDDIVDGIMSFGRTVLLVMRFVGFESFKDLEIFLFCLWTALNLCEVGEFLPNLSPPYGGFHWRSRRVRQLETD